MMVRQANTITVYVQREGFPSNRKRLKSNLRVRALFQENFPLRDRYDFTCPHLTERIPARLSFSISTCFIAHKVSNTFRFHREQIAGNFSHSQVAIRDQSSLSSWLTFAKQRHESCKTRTKQCSKHKSEMWVNDLRWKFNGFAFMLVSFCLRDM